MKENSKMKCKICDNETDIFDDPQLKKSYFVCSKCLCIGLNPSHYLSLEKEQGQYSHHQNSLENQGYVQMFEDFLDYFWNDLPFNQNSLDFGSGPTPVLAELLSRRNVNVDCYDKFYQPLKCFENKEYDFMTSTEVFEHLDDPISTLTLLAQHLRPKGLLAIMTLFHHNDQTHFLSWWYRRDPTHIVFYTPKTLEVLAEKCGFTVIKTDGKRIAVLQKR